MIFVFLGLGYLTQFSRSICLCLQISGCFYIFCCVVLFKSDVAPNLHAIKGRYRASTLLSSPADLSRTEFLIGKLRAMFVKT